MATIRDVAKRAGVSVAAVSKVLNGHPDIGQDTRQRIWDVVKELNYYPRASAQRLVTKTSRLIGVYYKSIDGMGIKQPFIAHVLNHFQDFMGHYGYDLVLFSESYSSIYNWTLTDRVRHQEVDGLLLIGDVQVDVVSLLSLGIPIVGLDVPVSGPQCGWVTSDNRRAVYDMVMWLARTGYSRIGFVHGPLDLPPSLERLEGFRKGMAAAGLSIAEEWIQFGGFDAEAGAHAARRFLGLHDMPEVIVCSADVSAIGAMHQFQDVGLRIPDDIGIVGFDDIEMAAYMKPRLTSIAQNKQALGMAAAQLLHSLMEERDTARITRRVIEVPTRAVVRESTRPLNGRTKME